MREEGTYTVFISDSETVHESDRFLVREPAFVALLLESLRNLLQLSTARSSGERTSASFPRNLNPVKVSLTKNPSFLPMLANILDETVETHMANFEISFPLD